MFLFRLVFLSGGGLDVSQNYFDISTTYHLHNTRQEPNVRYASVIRALVEQSLYMLNGIGE